MKKGEGPIGIKGKGQRKLVLFLKLTRFFTGFIREKVYFQRSMCIYYIYPCNKDEEETTDCIGMAQERLEPTSIIGLVILDVQLLSVGRSVSYSQVGLTDNPCSISDPNL